MAPEEVTKIPNPDDSCSMWVGEERVQCVHMDACLEQRSPIPLGACRNVIFVGPEIARKFITLRMLK